MTLSISAEHISSTNRNWHDVLLYRIIEKTNCMTKEDSMMKKSIDIRNPIFHPSHRRCIG